MQKLSISGYVLKLSANNVRNVLFFQLIHFLKAETSVVCTAVLNSVRIGVNYSLKLLTGLFHTGYTQRKKSSKKLSNSVRNDSLCDSPIESLRGWSVFDLIVDSKTLRLVVNIKNYSRGVLSYA